ncbi:MAG: hypothetical protein LLG04_18710, partial [Parachlamydia sp.]|nr:hypothetical protein [Parachlamydia sp.]
SQKLPLIDRAQLGLKHYHSKAKIKNKQLKREFAGSKQKTRSERTGFFSIDGSEKFKQILQL